MKSRVLLLVSFFLLASWGVSDGGTVVAAIEKDLGELSNPSTDELAYTPFGEFGEQAVKRGLELGFGDALSSPSDEILLQLECPGGSRMSFTGPFRIIVLPAAGGCDCAADLLLGEVHVETDTATTVVAGETTMGSEGTVYGVAVRTADAGRETSIQVFEGAVRLTSPGSTAPSTVGGNEGGVFVGTGWSAKPIVDADRDRAAAIFARGDVARAPELGDDQAKRREAYTTLKSGYVSALTEPGSEHARFQLATTQVKLGLPRPALFQLAQVKPVQLKSDSTRALLDALKGIAFQQLGDTVQARMATTRAQELDGNVFRNPGLQGVKFESRQPVMVVQPPQSPPVTLDLRPFPPVVGPGERSQIRIRASWEGRPVPRAQVILLATGGRFSDSQAPRTNGVTDDLGHFAASWICRPCNVQNTIEVRVLVPGHADAVRSVVIGRKQ